MKAVPLSISMLQNMKAGNSPKREIAVLQQLALSELAAELSNDRLKLLFWINCYNALMQWQAKKHPDLFLHRKAQFFKSKVIALAGRQLSLDDIEHRILRKGKFKWSLGYVSNPFLPRFFKKFQPEQLDFRIHFVLNCGAVSCPPVPVLEPHNINELLHAATDEYVRSTTTTNLSAGWVQVSRLFLYYLADFGGFKGIRNLLQKLGLLHNSHFKIRFAPYNNSTLLDNYL